MLRTLAILLALGAVARAEPGVAWWRLPGRDEVVARIVAEAGLRRGREWAPVTLAPDLAIGIDERVGVLVHSSRASEARLGAGNGVCVRPPNDTLGKATARCPSVDEGLGVSALVRLDDHTVARAGLIAREWSPLAIAAELGTSTTVHAGPVWAQLAPTLVVGVTARDAGDRDRVQVPLYVGVTPRAGVELHLRSGLDATLATFADTYAIPIGAGASVRVARVTIGLDVTLDKALGPLNATLWRSADLFVEAPL